LGHPNTEENKIIFEYIKNNHSEIYKYTKYKNTALIKIKINIVEMWLKGRELIDYENKTAKRIG